jgi:hypothetical protein
VRHSGQSPASMQRDLAQQVKLLEAAAKRLK